MTLQARVDRTLKGFAPTNFSGLQRCAAPQRSRRQDLAAATSVAVAVASALYGAPAAAADEDPLQEIVVTATRHSASAQDLPLSITAVTGASLEQAGIEDISSLAHSLAGVNFTDKGPFGGVNGASLIIRGLNGESTSGQPSVTATSVVPPVATYVDDTPLFVNLRLKDLDHVEILRGPQGTLYGSGSLGGTIRFVQNAPDLKGFDAKVDVGVSDTDHTHALNGEADGVLNLPVNDTLAFRLNAGWSADAGFINQPNLYLLDSSGAPISAQPGNVLSPPATHSRTGTNSYAYKTARLATLWKPNDDFHAQLSYYYQLSTGAGFPFSSPRYGLKSLASSDFTQASARDRVDLVALTVEQEFGFATLTVDASWGHHDNLSSVDVTPIYANFSFTPSLYGQNPRLLVTTHDELDDTSRALEIRLASKSHTTLEWVAGAYFNNQTTNIRENDLYPGYLDYFNACVPLYGVSNGDGVTPSQCGIGETDYTPGVSTTINGIPIIKDQAFINDFETQFKDFATFGELTWHVTKDWKITGGSRVFRQTVSQAQQTGLLFDGPAFISNNALNETFRRALWKINTAYQLDETDLVYATWSQGFRRGGVNALPATEPALGYVTPPGLFKLAPDFANNYEIGIKGTFANRLRYSAAIYDIEWHSVQEGALLTPLAIPSAINVGDATSRGFETELLASFTDHISATLDYTYDEAKLKSIAPLAQQGLSVPPAPPGTPLPGTPKSSLELGVEFGHFELAGGELRYAVSAHYQSSVVPSLSSNIPTVPGYATVDARVGFARPHWTWTLYGDNLTNQIGINSFTDRGVNGSYYQAIVSRPRTVGLRLAYSFKER